MKGAAFIKPSINLYELTDLWMGDVYPLGTQINFGSSAGFFPCAPTLALSPRVHMDFTRGKQAEPRIQSAKVVLHTLKIILVDFTIYSVETRFYR